MNALSLAFLNPLFDACREGHAQYSTAARTVGDPGLKLQFSHIASARQSILHDIAAALGVQPVLETVEQLEPQRVPAACGERPLLGGEAEPEKLTAKDLATLARRLREHDEHTLTQMRDHLPKIPCEATLRALERAMAVLGEDLEKIRILETLAAQQCAE